jgi:hypothetical protein
MYEAPATPSGPCLRIAELNLASKTFPKVRLMLNGGETQIYGTEVQWGEEVGQKQDRVLELPGSSVMRST